MVKMNFGLPPPTKKIIWGAYNIFLSKTKKIKVVQNCLKWRENWSKTSFGLFKPPPPKKNLRGVQKNFDKNEKNQSCSKLPEMARKLVKIEEKNESRFKLPEMARKLGKNCFWNFLYTS